MLIFLVLLLGRGPNLSEETVTLELSDLDLASAVECVRSFIIESNKWETSAYERSQESYSQGGSGVDFHELQQQFRLIADSHWIGEEWTIDSMSFGRPAKHDPECEVVVGAERIAPGVVEVIATFPYPWSTNKKRERIYRLESAAAGNWLIRRYFDLGERKSGGELVWQSPESLSSSPRQEIPQAAAEFVGEPILTAVRLRPVRDDRVKCRSSHFGGDFLGNEVESWPRCEDHNTALIGVVQLQKEDIPELPFKKDESTCQVLWCPFDHPDQYCPMVVVRWLTEEQARETGLPNPTFRHPSFDYSPNRCRTYPERITELTGFWAAEFRYDIVQLRDRYDDIIKHLMSSPEGRTFASQFDQFFDKEKDHSNISKVDALIGPAIGNKVGGYPDWIQHPQIPSCDECGQSMQLLITVSSVDWDNTPISRHLFCPVECESMTRDQQTGLVIGRSGRLYIFICQRCDHRPIKRILQS